MKPVLLAFVGVSAFACARSPGTIFRAVPWQVAIPQYNVDSVTRDSASVGAGALVGTVVDSISGKPLESAQILLRVPGGGRTFRAITDSRGGFVLGRVPPGHYHLVVRLIGYEAVTGVNDARAGVVDTLRARMSRSILYLVTGRGVPTAP
ncbi:MAG TPA: carboxypeptidase-like regulatory domain-containing protein [Gemmatimonadaceae bacterium]|nr:carboxypeptidase-like regulatory domain-containing protein [Gemmatimonadaceae bacterium]